MLTDKDIFRNEQGDRRDALITDLAAAIAFLTRLPVGRYFTFSAHDVARSERWFPLVGALIGGINVAALLLCKHFFPSFVTATIIMGVTVLLTGALHLDGVADSADGFGGGWRREDVLRIMKDHAIGSYGGVALVLLIALKVTTMAALIDAHRAMTVLVLAPALGRWAAVMLSATQPHCVLNSGAPQPSEPIASFVGKTELIIASISALVAGFVLERWHGLVACGLVLLCSVGWAWYCRRRIGGITGDALGANIEMAECVVLLWFTALR